MSIRTRILEAQQARHEALSEPRPYTRTIELQREIGGFSCQFEVSVKQWTNDGPMPEIDCVSDIEAFDRGGHSVTNKHIMATLNDMAKSWCREHIDEIISEIERKPQ